MSALTLEERFLLTLFKKAPHGGSVPLAELCKELSLHPQKAATIAKSLHRANFLQKKEEFLVLTAHGRKLVEQLQC